MSEVCVTSVTRGHSVPYMVQGYTAAHSVLQICPQSAQLQITSGGTCRQQYWGCGASELSIVSTMLIIFTISTGRDLVIDMTTVPAQGASVECRQRLTCMQTLQADTAHLSHIILSCLMAWCEVPDDGSKSSYCKQLAADVGGGCGECGGSSGTQHPAPAAAAHC